MRRTVIFFFFIAISLNGCTMIPKYYRPQAPVPASWPAGTAYATKLAKPVNVSQLKWREFYTDPKLKQIIEVSLQNNRDLRLTILNVERARALYGVQRVQLLPTVNADGEGAKQRLSSDFIARGAKNTVEQYDVNLGIAAWEVDFLGRIRSLSERALEEYLQTEEARRSAQISLISQVATIYYTIAAQQTNLTIARSTLDAQQSGYNLIRKRCDANIANEIDLQRAQTQVDAARLDVATYTQQLAQAQNALNLLAGTSVEENLLAKDLASATPPKDLSPGLPSEVLLKRPDIVSAEHQLKGAYANIGAARAAFFPRISLTTLLGSASAELSDLFSAGTKTWIYGAQVTMPIFDARTWFAYRVSKADREIAVAQYEKTIQTAFREVADVLAVSGTVDEQIAAQQSTVDAAKKIYELANKRYMNGIDSYLGVLDAQRNQYAAQQRLISLELSKFANKVRTYAVLGGGVEYSQAGKTSIIKKMLRFFRI